MIRSVAASAIALALAAVLAACGGAEEESPQAEDLQETLQSEPTEPKPQDPEGTSSDGDRTEDLRSAANGQAWADNITTATESEPGRLEVATDLVDPRGGNGSPEAQTAIQICETTVSLLKDDGAQEPYVAVMEKDGTHWVLYGHPAYPDGCTEV